MLYKSFYKALKICLILLLLPNFAFADAAATEELAGYTTVSTTDRITDRFTSHIVDTIPTPARKQAVWDLERITKQIKFKL